MLRPESFAAFGLWCHSRTGRADRFVFPVYVVASFSCGRCVLGRNRVEDQGAQHLAQLELEELDLTGNSVGDAGAKALSKPFLVQESQDWGSDWFAL